MPYTGITTRKGRCAICKTDLPPGTLVYHNPSKRDGFHLAHTGCWENLRATRGPARFEASEKISDEPLDPPF